MPGDMSGDVLSGDFKNIPYWWPSPLQGAAMNDPNQSDHDNAATGWAKTRSAATALA